MRRLEEKPVRYAPRVGIAAHDEILGVIAKNDRAGRARRINRPVKGAVGIAVVAMSHARGVNVITAGRVRVINLIGQSRRRAGVESEAGCGDRRLLDARYERTGSIPPN